MNDETKQLLDEVIKNRLKQASNVKAEEEGGNTAFKQAMEAIDRQIEISKLDTSYQEMLDRQEQSKREAKFNRILRIGELVGITIAVPIIQYCCNMRYAKLMCNFEKDYTFTTSAGRSCSRLFKFGK